MNREDIIAMAREAGMAGMLTDVVTTFDELERFAALVAAAEREACAKVGEEYSAIEKIEEFDRGWLACAKAMAAAIRARGQA